MYEEMMTNNDNVESSLLTSILLKICSLYNFCYKLHMLSCRGRVVSSISGGSRISRWGGGADPLGRCQPPMHTLFGKNVCENERNLSCWGGGHMPVAPPGSANVYDVCCPSSDKCGEHIALYRAIVYCYLTGSIMGCSLRVTRAGVAG